MNFKRSLHIFICFFLVFFLCSTNLQNNFSSFSFQAPKKPVDIVVVEQPPKGNDKNGNPYDRDNNKNGKNALEETFENYNNKKDKLGIEYVLRATSVKNMVDNILGALKEDECIQTLVIAGHGEPGVIGVGDGLNSEPGKHINGENKKEWEEELKRLKDKFCPGASLLLKGCNVGSCDLGAKKLKEMADLLGIPVEAPTGETYPDCSSETGSVNQRAEPTKPGGKKDPPKCILSPADQIKIEADGTYKGKLPYQLDQVLGLEIYPIGGPIPITDVPRIDINPGEETFNQFIYGVNYEAPVSYKQDLIAKFNAVILIRFKDGSMQKGMFHTDFDYFEYPYIPEAEQINTKVYPTLSWKLEQSLEEICKQKLNIQDPDTEFNLTAKAECGFIMLNWNPIKDALRYFIYRGPGEGQEYPMPLTDFPISETSYKDEKGLVHNQKYCYYVKAVNKEDKEFNQSNEACAVLTCKEETPPLSEVDCKMILKYQVDNKFYWKNEIKKGPMDAVPVIREQRVNMMARYLAEETGATVGWEQTTKTVIITRIDNVVIKMQIGNPIAMVNGVPSPIDPNNPSVVPFIENNRTYTGLRFIAYNLGATGPDEIIWRADTRIAELIFKDPNCKWLCGCFRKSSSNPSANIAEYNFYEDCNTEKQLKSKLLMDMKDRIHKITLLEYVQKYPNQEYWCVEIRVDEKGNIVAWRARPDLYPKCCK